MLKNICVYCASSTQVAPVYFKLAEELGNILVEEKLNLVYGAGSIGLMGKLADTVIEGGGNVIGVIPYFMCEQEWDHKSLTELIKTDTMHQRKEKMAEIADAVIALPGGCGTMEELLEVITWKQLGIFNKPVVIVNANHYYDDLLNMLEKSIDQKFMRDMHRGLWTVVDKAEDILSAIKNSPVWDSSIRKLAKI